MEYSRAKHLADRLIEKLGPFCEICNIAGSIRRGRPVCNDIEIVCKPHTRIINVKLFDGEKEIISPDFVAELNSCSQQHLKGTVEGRYMQILLKGGATLDLFMPQKNDFYRIYTIRTGSADYVREVLGTAWKKLGWCGTPYGLRRMSDCIEQKHGWQLINKNGEKPPVWESEQEFFTWLHVPFIPPNLREVAQPHSKPWLRK